MKSKLVVPAALILIICISATHENVPQKMDVFTALEKNLISAVATSNGLNAEECVRFEIKNLSATPLQLTIPAGVIMNTLNESDQDIIITKPAEIFVGNRAVISQPLYGFCCQSSNGVPEEGSNFKLQKGPNENLTKLATHLSENAYDPLLQQAAIWAVSDQHSVGGIYSDNRKLDQQLREFTANLLGQKVPFYDVDYGYQLNTPYVYEPKTLVGNMRYQLDTPGLATLTIFSPDGHPYHIFYENKRMSWGYYTQNFRFTATGMEPGEYKVKFVVDGRLVSEQSIIV